MNKEFCCDCNVIHEDVVNDAISKMPDRAVLDEVDSNEMCVCDIANVLRMTKSSISHQLNILKMNNIVKCRNSGKEVYYTLDDEHVKEVFEVALSHVMHKECL